MGGGGGGGECGQSMLPSGEENKHTFQLPSLFHAHSHGLSPPLNVHMHLVHTHTPPHVHSTSPACTSAAEFLSKHTFTHRAVLGALVPPRHGPCGGFSLVLGGLGLLLCPALLPSHLGALLCVKCWRWLIFVFPPLWERKTQLIHCDPSLIPSASTRSLCFLPSFGGFSPQRLPSVLLTDACVQLKVQSLEPRCQVSSRRGHWALYFVRLPPLRRDMCKKLLWGQVMLTFTFT